MPNNTLSPWSATALSPWSPSHVTAPLVALSFGKPAHDDHAYADLTDLPLPNHYVDSGNRRERRAQERDALRASAPGPRKVHLSSSERRALGRTQAINAVRRRDQPASEQAENFERSSGNRPLGSSRGERVTSFSNQASSWLNQLADSLSMPLSWLQEVTGYSDAPREAEEVPTLRALMAELREAGLQKVFLAEVHRQYGNIPMITQTLQGALDRGDITFYREADVYTAPRDIAPQMSNPEKNHNLAAQKIFEFTLNAMFRRMPEAKVLKEILAGPGVKLAALHFYEGAESNGLASFARDKTFAVASLGLAHVLWEHVEGRKTNVPWIGIDDSLYPSLPMSRPLTEFEKKSTYGGLKKAQRYGTTVFVLQSQCWPELDEDHPHINSREAVTAHYNKEGYAIMDVPLRPGINATIFAPGSLLPTLNEFARQHNGKVSLHCSGIPGCEEPARDEL